jgi:hypothetical protein
MKAQVTITSTASARWFRRSLVGLAVLIALAAGVGVALALRGGITSAPAAVPPVNVGVPAPLDLFDRHPELLAPRTRANQSLDLFDRHPELLAPADARAPLDAHERHTTTNTAVPAALDLHERHPASVGVPAPLDLHERHP